MAVVYRYTDLADNTIKYVGIVWSGNRTLKQRDEEHRKNDDWCRNHAWIVEYLQKEVKSRTDAEMLEAHYISKFGTADWYNVRKANWGESDYVDDADDKWELYSTDEEDVSDNVAETTIIDARYEMNDNGYSFLRLETEDGKIFLFRVSSLIAFSFSNGYNMCIRTFDLLGTIRRRLGYNSLTELEGEKVKYLISEVDGELIAATINVNDETDSAQTIPFVFCVNHKLGEKNYYLDDIYLEKQQDKDELMNWIIDYKLSLYDCTDNECNIRQSFEQGLFVRDE